MIGGYDVRLSCGDESAPIRCPYSDSKVWCDRVSRKELIKGTPAARDSCEVIVSVGWDQ